MFKKILKKLTDPIFWKFILVGIANTLFGTAVMFVFYNVFHFGYWVSSAANYVFGSILSYVLNRIFTFKSNEKLTRTVPRFIINISICYLVAYGVAKRVVAYCLSDFSATVQDNLSMLAGMGLFVLLNYIGQRYFVFKGSSKTK